MKLPKDLSAFIALLNAAHVKYVIVGGYAVAYHGRPRFTGDIDIFIDRSIDNGEKIVSVLEAFGFAELKVSAADLCQNDLILQLGFPPNRIDLMTSIDGVSFEQTWATRVETTVAELPIHFISRELLIQNKRCAGRPKDLADAEELSS
ncbi:MAG: hypothetical protein M0Z50_06280 [Planctomycetia bacterium]|jgi:hypothetical protein|nr:hypothetical protein [Planctomycetia bacterium]